METRIELEILQQPNDYTCGPTCLHALYRYYGERVSLEQVVQEVCCLEEGGTLAPLLGIHALRRGYSARIYTWDLQVFDPTWFLPHVPSLAERLEAQMAVKEPSKLQTVTRAYLEFMNLGGGIRMEDLTVALIRKYLNHQVPILAGLSATYLYQAAREHGPNWDPDDIRGSPAGHFVLLCGYDRESRTVLVADPLKKNPFGASRCYSINIDRVLCAILLGILTYDSKLLIIEPCKKHERRRRADPDRGQ